MATAADRRRSWWLIAALGGAAIAQPIVGCLPSDVDPPASVAGGLLADFGPEVIVPTLDRFASAVTDLDAAVVAWGVEGDRQAARTAWADAMAVWQELEVMQIGPAASSLSAVGGADLRDEIYSWPTINPCRVDQETITGSFSSPDFFTENLVNTYGMDALEHLLYAGEANACPSQIDINAEGTWDALGSQGVDAARAEYARHLVVGVAATVDVLVTAWSSDDGTFSTWIASPGVGDSPYGSDQEAINAIYDALFYLELTTKDRKLADPLGLGSCSTDCAELVESVASGWSGAWVAANLRGFRTVFTGGDGAGLDDLLDDRGHADLVDRILVNVDAALEAAAAAPMSLDEAIADDPADVVALYEAVKRVTDDLKGDVATVLSLQLPNEAAGDND